MNKEQINKIKRRTGFPLNQECYIITKEEFDELVNCDSNPSEALECLERIDNTLCLNNIKGKLEFGIDTEEHTDCDSVIGMTDDLETIKQALIQAEQDKKKAICWDIVKEKSVDVSLIKKYDFVEDYNSAVWIAGRPKLVKEEFTTLKEVEE